MWHSFIQQPRALFVLGDCLHGADWAFTTSASLGLYWRPALSNPQNFCVSTVYATPFSNLPASALPWKCPRLIQLRSCTALSISRVRIHHLLFTLLIPQTLRSKNYKGWGMWWYRIPSKSHLCSSTATYMNSSPPSLSSPLLVVIATRVSWDSVYDNGGRSLATVACYDGKMTC